MVGIDYDKRHNYYVYSFIARIVSLLEDELDELGSKKSKGEIIIKKNITETLNKLVNLIIQLNKLSKNEDVNENTIVKEEDEAIISEFLQCHSRDGNLDPRLREGDIGSRKDIGGGMILSVRMTAYDANINDLSKEVITCNIETRLE